jgi:hypothetical protein
MRRTRRLARRLLRLHLREESLRTGVAAVGPGRAALSIILFVVAYAVRKMMCRPESESTTSDIWPTSSAYVPSCARQV